MPSYEYHGMPGSLTDTRIYGLTILLLDFFMSTTEEGVKVL